MRQKEADLHDDAMRIACRECGAAPQGLCMTVKGFSQKVPHAARINQAIQNRLMQR